MGLTARELAACMLPYSERYVFLFVGGGGGGGRGCTNGHDCDVKPQVLCGEAYLNGDHHIWSKLIHASSDVLHIKLFWEALNKVI